MITASEDERRAPARMNPDKDPMSLAALIVTTAQLLARAGRPDWRNRPGHGPGFSRVRWHGTGATVDGTNDARLPLTCIPGGHDVSPLSRTGGGFL
jgi:hypothetical protein